MKKILLFFFLVAPLFSFSQLLTDSAKINIHWLENAVKNKIDSVRATKVLMPLINDSVLYLASTDQAKYLTTKTKLTHYQEENIEKKTPQNRADFYGAKNYQTGENIVVVSLEGRNEEEMANAMVTAWVNSPGHYANIINGGYDITGIAIVIDNKNNRVFCVQTFALVNELYSISENKSLFPYAKKVPQDVAKNFVSKAPRKHTKHAYGITEKNKAKICAECDKDIFTNENISVRGHDDSVYIGIRKGSLQKVKNYFKEKKDGLAFEFVIFDYTYSCDPANNTVVPTRRNGACEFNGPITAPQYTEYILAQIKLAEEFNEKHKIRLDRNERIEVNLGKFPDYIKGQRFEVNLLIFKKNRLCQVLQTINVCGEAMINDLPQLPYLDSLTPITYVPQNKPMVRSIKVYFEKNKSASTSDTVIEAVNEIKNSHQRIVKAKIKAYASVEGSKELNEKLFIKRAESVLAQFEAQQDSLIPYEIETKENWELFRKQLAASNLKHMLEWDSLKLRAFVNDTANAKLLEPYFAKQRYAVISLYSRPKINSANLIYFAFDNYKNLSQSKTITPTTIAKMVQIQQFLYHEVVKGKLSIDSVHLIYPRENAAFVQMRFNEVMFDFLYGELQNDHLALKKEMEEINKLDPKNQLVVYNWYATLFNSHEYQYISDELKNTIELIKLLERYKFSTDTLHEFFVHENHLIINKYFYRLGGRLKPTEQSLNIVHSYYLPKLDTASDDFKFQLAKYYVFSEQYAWAMELLQPMALKENFNHEIYILYLKVYQSMQLISADYNDLNLVLIEAHEKLTKEEWCDLFIGSCNINFHIFEDSTLKNIYCSSCKAK